MKFCSDCGNPIAVREFEGRPRFYCPPCQRIHYRQLKVGAAALIEQDQRLLLLKRTSEPYLGCWNLPAGYVEADEHPGDAVVRETLEETGLRVAINKLAAVYFYDDDPRGNGIVVVYHSRIIGGTLGETAEAISPTFFTADELPSNLAGGGNDQAIRTWRNNQVIRVNRNSVLIRP